MKNLYDRVINMPLHPEVGAKVSKHRNHNVEVLAVMALSLISTLAAYSIMLSAGDVVQQAQAAGLAAYVR